MVAQGRKTIRLNDYDYSQMGAYFITVCTFEKMNLFGEFINGEMVLNDIGKIVWDEWIRSSEIRNEIQLDEFVIMPNHMHGIIIIKNDYVGATGRSPVHERPNGPPKKSLGSFMSGFKSSVTKHINIHRNTPTRYVWQRNYYDHIIRDEMDMDRVRQYNQNNPVNWDTDKNNITNHAGATQGAPVYRMAPNPDQLAQCSVKIEKRIAAQNE